MLELSFRLVRYGHHWHALIRKWQSADANLLFIAGGAGVEVPVELKWYKGHSPKLHIAGWRVVRSQLGLRAGQVIELDVDPADRTRLLLRVLPAAGAAAQLPEPAPFAGLPERQHTTSAAAEAASPPGLRQFTPRCAC